jgi:tetratricopeptide (TPR) repeat protein
MKNPVAATFAISFEQIKKSDPQAADILSIMSMLDTQAIPTSLLPLEKDIGSTKALGTLQAFSLITKASQQEREDQLFDMHRLVRLIMRKWLRERSEVELWTRKAISSVSERFPAGSHEKRNVCRVYLPHALKILSPEQTPSDQILPEATQPSQETLKETKIAQAALQFCVSWYLQTKGDFILAEPIARASSVLRETVLGKEHPDTLRSMNNLAGLLYRQGKYKEAEKMNRQTLELTETVLGKNHPNTLISMSNLAVVLDRQGKYEEAEKMNRQTLELRETVLGKEHLKTLASMNNLAGVLDRQGKYEEAEKINRQTLELTETVLGKNHPNTLISMNNLTWVLDRQSKYGEAEKINRQTLKLRETVLGKEHPDTLISMSKLTGVLDRQGKYKEAEKINRQTLKLRETVLGREHLKTLASMNKLAGVLNRQGKYGAARRPLSIHQDSHLMRYCLRGRPRPCLTCPLLIISPFHRCCSKITTLFVTGGVMRKELGEESKWEPWWPIDSGQARWF